MANEPSAKISEIDELKLVYFEILAGYSFDAESSLYIRHFSDEESFLVLQKRAELFQYYSAEGVPHESELLKNAMTNEEWSQEKEDHILELKYHISDNEKAIHNIIQEQRGGILKIIEEKKQELSECIMERKAILGRSIEDLIDEDVNDYVIYLSFFKDKGLTTHVTPTYSDFQNYSITEISTLNYRLSVQYQRFTEEKVKGVACLPLFLNKINYCKENVFAFLNKPIASLTHHQSFLFSLGLRNLEVMSKANGSPPDINLDAKIKDIVHWYDIQNSIMIAKKNQSE